MPLPSIPSRLRATRRQRGIAAWAWLQILGLNCLYLEGPPLLTRLIKFRAVPTPAQLLALGRARRLARVMIRTRERISAAQWSKVSRTLRVDYWGGEVTKAFPLTLKQVLPALPPVGVAGTCALEDWLSEDSRRRLLDPSLLLRRADDVEGPLPKSRVLVESQREYEAIVEALLERGIVEPEVPEETFCHEGAPVYNGLFGVSKGHKTVDGEDIHVLRLIVNLTPTNRLQFAAGGASQHMGYAGLWGNTVVLDDEFMRIYSEDQSACFHCYTVPPCWRGAFVLERKVAAGLGGRSPERLWRPRLRVVPMGWLSAVDFIQEAHERMATLPAPRGAGIPSESLMAMRRLLPDQAKAAPRTWVSIYVDNADQVVVYPRGSAPAPGHGTSPELGRLREVYAQAGVLRAPDKAAEGLETWESLGAEFAGGERLVGTSATRRARVLSAVLHCLLLRSVSLTELMVVVGRLVHVFEFRRELLAVFGDVFSAMQRQPGRRPLPRGARRELALAACLLPLAWSNVGAGIDPVVAATDAALTGGGACASRGLTQAGRERVEALQRGLALEARHVLLITANDALGVARHAADLAGAPLLAHVAVEPSKDARRLLARRWPAGVAYSRFEDFEAGIERSWGADLSAATLVLCFIVLRPPEPDWLPASLRQWTEAASRVGEALSARVEFVVADPFAFGGVRIPGCVERRLAGPAEGPAAGPRLRLFEPTSSVPTGGVPPDLTDQEWFRRSRMTAAAARRAGAGGRRAREAAVAAAGLPRDWVDAAFKDAAVKGVDEGRAAALVELGLATALALPALKELFIRAGEAAPAGRGFPEPSAPALPDALDLAPGSLARSWSRAYGARGEPPGAARVLRSSISEALPEHLIVLHHLRMATHRRSDVRLDTGQPFMTSTWPRQPVPPRLWHWRVTASYGWRHQNHITALEVLAHLGELRTVARDPARHSARMLHLLDSQAGIAALAKGRSSSRILLRLLRRTAAVTLAMDHYPLYGWIRSEDNPADGPSRWCTGHGT